MVIFNRKKLRATKKAAEIAACKYGENAKAYRLCLLSDETLTALRPFLLRAFKTRRPLADAMRSLNPCLFLRFRCEG